MPGHDGLSSPAAQLAAGATSRTVPTSHLVFATLKSPRALTIFTL
jgi:hypothetical protein